MTSEAIVKRMIFMYDMFKSPRYITALLGFMIGFFVSPTAALLRLRYWLHRRRQLLEAGVLELREMRLAGAIAKGVQYPAYP